MGKNRRLNLNEGNDMKLSLSAAHSVGERMSYNMHGVVAALLNTARKREAPFSIISRVEAAQILRRERVLAIHGGILSYLPGEEGDDLFSPTPCAPPTFFCFMSGKSREVQIPWNHVLLLIRASYLPPHRSGEDHQEESGVRLRRTG